MTVGKVNCAVIPCNDGLVGFRVNLIQNGTFHAILFHFHFTVNILGLTGLDVAKKFSTAGSMQQSKLSVNPLHQLEWPPSVFWAAELRGQPFHECGPHLNI